MINFILSLSLFFLSFSALADDSICEKHTNGDFDYATLLEIANEPENQYLDFDGDGIPNKAELLGETSPCLENSNSGLDKDDDGLIDEVEELLSGTKIMEGVQLSIDSSDTDENGKSDLEEVCTHKNSESIKIIFEVHPFKFQDQGRKFYDFLINFDEICQAVFLKDVN